MNELQRYLAAEDLKQTDLARSIGISESMLSLILSGERKPGIALTKRIEAVTGIQRHLLRPDVYEAVQ